MTVTDDQVDTHTEEPGTVNPTDVLGDDDAAEGPLEAEGAAKPRRKIDLLIPGLILTVLGLTLVLFFAYALSFSGFKEQRAQRQMLNIFTTPAGAVPLSGKLPPDGTPAAVLRIPKIHLHQIVLQGSGPAQTAKGPGLMTGTARPGTIGNAVIIGRSVTGGKPFADLHELKVGDRLSLASGLGKFHYRVAKTGYAKPGQIDPASPVNHAELTLVTANAPLSNNIQYYVVARQTTAPGAAAKPHHKPTTIELGLAGDPHAVLPSILLGLVYLAALIGTVIAYRRFRSKALVIYVLTTPIILALAFWWFQNLYLLLPSSM